MQPTLSSAAALKRPLHWLALIDGDADTIFHIDPRPQVNVQFLFHVSAWLHQRNAYRTAVIVENGSNTNGGGWF